MAVNEEEDAEGIRERLLPVSSVLDTDHTNQGERVLWKVTFLAGAALASLFSKWLHMGIHVHEVLLPHTSTAGLSLSDGDIQLF